MLISQNINNTTICPKNIFFYNLRILCNANTISMVNLYVTTSGPKLSRNCIITL